MNPRYLVYLQTDRKMLSESETIRWIMLNRAVGFFEVGYYFNYRDDMTNPVDFGLFNEIVMKLGYKITYNRQGIRMWVDAFVPGII